jgi:hypothetical protein
MLRSFSIVFFVLGLSGCATAPPEPHVQKVNGLMVVSNTADVEGLIIKDRSSPEQMCAGRMVNVSDTSDVSLGVSQATTAESIGESTGVVSLGGINPAVHMTSELMYRACELSLNLDLDDKGSAKIYESVLAAIVTISGHYSTSTGTKSVVSNASYMNNVKASGYVKNSNRSSSSATSNSAASTNMGVDSYSSGASSGSYGTDSTDSSATGTTTDNSSSVDDSYNDTTSDPTTVTDPTDDTSDSDMTPAMLSG